MEPFPSDEEWQLWLNAFMFAINTLFSAFIQNPDSFRRSTFLRTLFETLPHTAMMPHPIKFNDLEEYQQTIIRKEFEKEWSRMRRGRTIRSR